MSSAFIIDDTRCIEESSRLCSHGSRFWSEPRGSEQDDLEQEAEHRFIKNKAGEVLALF